jgi:hypothetical protein
MKIVASIFIIIGIFHFFIKLVTPAYSGDDVFKVCDAFIFVLLISALISINEEPFNKKR